MQRHLVLLDADEAELVEEPLSLVTELFDEHVVRSPSSERGPRIAVQVRHDQVDLLLAERVERDAFPENAPQVQVKALDVRLLARAVWVAVEHPHAARHELVRVVLGGRAVVLHHLGVAELGAVVRDYAAEQLAEEFGASNLPEHVDDAREGLRRLRVPEEREGQFPADHEGEEDLAADRADDGVRLRRHDAGIRLEPFEHVRVRASDAAFRIGLRLRPLVRPAAGSGEGQVVLLRGEEPVLDPSVDRASRVSAEQLRIACDYRVDRLALPCGGGEDIAHLADCRLVGMNSAAAVDENSPVVGLGTRGDIVALAHRAVVLALASVADVGGPVQADAHVLAEVGARLEASGGVPPADVAEAVECRPFAVVETGAQPVRASVVLVAVDPAVQQLARDGRLGPSESPPCCFRSRA